MNCGNCCWKMTAIAMIVVLTYSLTCQCFTLKTRPTPLTSQQRFSSTPSYESMLERAQAMKKLTSQPQPPAALKVAVKAENVNNNKASNKKIWTPAQKSSGVEVVVNREEPNTSAATDSPVPWTGNKPVEQMTAREKASFKNKVPFSEEIYEVLKTTIELLSTRINEPEKKLTLEEATWLLQAIEVILDDAKRFGPPPKPESKPK